MKVMINVSDLSEERISVVESVTEALRNNNLNE
jgi:hypothetical protein